MTCPGNPADWDERTLSLGKVSLMDTPTFLEWTQQEMETPEETRKRHEDLDREHRQWHLSQTHYISACYINMMVDDLQNKDESKDEDCAVPADRRAHPR